MCMCTCCSSDLGTGLGSFGCYYCSGRGSGPCTLCLPEETFCHCRTTYCCSGPCLCGHGLQYGQDRAVVLRAVRYIGISNYRGIELETVPYFAW